MSMCVSAFLILLDEALWQQLVKITRHQTNIPFLSLSLFSNTHTHAHTSPAHRYTDCAP